MIYIISEKQDLVTDLVVEWLVGKNKNFKRFHTNEFEDSATIISNDQDQLKEFAGAEKVWQRRGALDVLPKTIFSNYSNRTAYIDYLLKEVSILTNYQENQLKKRLGDNYIGSLNKEVSNNKLINLAIAKEVGFDIPNSLITTSKNELLKFRQKYGSLISKDLRAPVYIKTRYKDIISRGVEMIDDKSINALAEIFAPMFIQQYIQKVYEIRAFVICNKIYSMAIFSQNDEQTKVDFRNYNKAKPNRCVPLKLPEQVEQMIKRFMDKAQMNTGSIDLIYTPKGEYCFLEINPMGQFHWLSQNCNYHIEREIAKFLSDEEN